MRQVVDASALLTYLLDEPGGDRVQSVEGSLCLSSVNLAEVLTRSIDRGLASDDVTGVLKALPIAHFEFTRRDAVRAAALRAESRKHGLSLGDRACLALAQRLVLTADRAWAEIRYGVDIRLIR